MIAAAADLAKPREEVLELDEVLQRIAVRAEDLDRRPRFPIENLRELSAAGALKRSDTDSLTSQIGLVRRVARADGATARIVDGHLNGAERLTKHAPPQLAEDELDAIAQGRLILGVWGADPGAGEGEPARLVPGEDGALALSGVKVFCSGAGGVDRALVVAREGDGERRLAYVDATNCLQIDRDWYRGSGLRASESHRVVFVKAPVLALLGGADELLRQPDFARDGVRTAATWAGLCDTVSALTSAAVADAASADSHQDAALGSMQVAIATIDLWLDEAARRLDGDGTDEEACGQLAAAARAGITEASRAVLDASARACGSRAIATLPALDRSRRDLELFLLQHRLEPMLEKLGRSARRRFGGR
jgi:alkylation response protein AidB-like acyl-CoA dehydrogenase